MKNKYLLFLISFSFILSSYADETNLMVLVKGYTEDSKVSYVSSPVKVDLKSYTFVSEGNFGPLKELVAETIRKKRRKFRITDIDIITEEDKTAMRKQYQEYNTYEKFNITSLLLKKAQKSFEENPDAGERFGKKRLLPKKKKGEEMDKEEPKKAEMKKPDPEASKKSVFDIYD